MVLHLILFVAVSFGNWLPAASLDAPGSSENACGGRAGIGSSLIQSKITAASDENPSLPWNAKDFDSILDFEDFEPDLQKLAENFQSGLDHLISELSYDRDEPVVVTVLDSLYNEFLVPWASRLDKLGLKQQVIIALDDNVAEIVRAHDLPALDARGHGLSKASMAQVQTTQVQTHGQDDTLPSDFSEIKFLVSYLLLKLRYTVVFSEMDVFLFTNPMEAMWKASPWNRQLQETVQTPAGGVADIVGMVASVGNYLNIGFMQFQGPHAAHAIKQFLLKWQTVGDQDAENKAQDQLMFDNIVLNELPAQGKALDMRAVQREHFVVTDGRMDVQVTNATLVVHLAGMPADAKLKALRELYSKYEDRW